MIRFLAVLSGILLIGSITLMIPWAGLPAIALVAAGWWFRPAAVAAVLLAIGVLAWADTGILAAAATGLVATAYLLNTATVTAPVGVVPTTIPSVTGAVAFTVLAATAALLPLHLPWAPALAPLLVIPLFALLIHNLAPRRVSSTKET
ncbi:hypothetical protein IU485_27390 [Nocardia cyriacigeorgica]|uniref:Integral membrane protein n=1 Tax=Nocardia cyriacigeorgica (strain GUH-2) TaxID=1127134 RepID=H6RBU5_NOCCG|nr:hypothetical protein [Nocardia cyriacigeorgica]MBF6085100.1 hypothetical protein [Nocardia cyriacigeorgica]MBF6424661.1 hypothetical protein [Nocardia cyriacigeorgica]CCF61288.1 conserved membrane protein of unknown function [Nocardia cyriacigeorgica GUH-2]